MTESVAAAAGAAGADTGSSSEPLRIGILGAARIAELSIVKPAAATGHRLVAVAARDPEATAFAGAHRVERVHDTYDDLITDPDVEVVYNPLANGLHGHWNLRAIEAGKHVLSEKPFAANAAEAREVVAAAQACGVTVLEAFHYPFHRCSSGSATSSPPGPSARCGTWRRYFACLPSRRRSPLVAGAGRRGDDGPRLLRPALRASSGRGSWAASPRS